VRVGAEEPYAACFECSTRTSMPCHAMPCHAMPHSDTH
jgi:hypothetical protein